MADQDKIVSPNQDDRLENYPTYGTGADVQGTGSPGQEASTQTEPAYDGVAASEGASGGGNPSDPATHDIDSSGPRGRSSL